MAQQKQIIIDLPGSPEVLQDLMRFLLKRGLISKKAAQQIEDKKISAMPNKKGRWALAAERLKSEGFLSGQGEEVKKLIRDFRDGLDI
jgi:hypothetical protein